MKRFICTLFAAVMLLGGAVTAQAAGWGFDINGSIANPSYVGNGAAYVTEDGLSWGPAGNANAGNRNSISFANGSLTIVDNPANQGYGTLTGGTLNLEVAVSYDGAAAGLFSHSIDFGYMETENWGYGFDNDIMYFSANDAWKFAQNVSNGDGNAYYYSLLDSFVNLNDIYFEYVGLYLDPSQSYYGFIVPEGGSQQFLLSAAAQNGAAPTPEPGTVMLMGAGLAGLAFLRRRMK